MTQLKRDAILSVKIKWICSTAATGLAVDWHPPPGRDSFKRADALGVIHGHHHFENKSK